MRSSGLAALFAAVISAGCHRELHRELQHAQLHPRDILNIRPSGVCSAFPTITAQLQPVAYNEFFPYTTVIFPFRNGVPFTVSNAPTDVRITSTLTYLITPSTVPTVFNPTVSNPTVSNPTVSNPTASNPTASNPTTGLPISQGLPTGIVGNLADETFIFLAFSNYPRATPIIGRRQGNMRRQEVSATRPIDAVNLAQPASLPSGGLSQDNCDSASPFLLHQGRLVQYTLAVGKRVFEIAPMLGLPLSPPPEQVNMTFSLNNGVLQWLAADFNEDATFYDCGGLLYAGFDTIPSPDCMPVVVGAIAGSVCVDRVQQTRARNPTFVAPIAASTSSPTTVTVPSISPPSSTPTSIISGSTSTFTPSSVSSPSASPLTGSSRSTPASLNSDLIISTMKTFSSSASPPASSSAGLSSVQASSSTSSSTSSSSLPSSASSSLPSRASIPASPSSSQSSTTVTATSGTATTIDTSTITTVTTTDTTPSTTATAATTTRSPVCSDLPDPYTASNGKRFDITCDVVYTIAGEDIITSTQTPDFVTCINLCSTTSGCAYADFETFVDNECTLAREVFGTVANVPGGQVAALIQ